VSWRESSASRHCARDGISFENDRHTVPTPKTSIMTYRSVVAHCRVGDDVAEACWLSSSSNLLKVGLGMAAIMSVIREGCISVYLQPIHVTPLRRVNAHHITCGGMGLNVENSQAQNCSITHRVQ
jgi:hypothetical protein